jgi:hypothetical protein
MAGSCPSRSCLHSPIRWSQLHQATIENDTKATLQLTNTLHQRHRADPPTVNAYV